MTLSFFNVLHPILHQILQNTPASSHFSCKCHPRVAFSLIFCLNCCTSFLPVLPAESTLHLEDYMPHSSPRDPFKMPSYIILFFCPKTPKIFPSSKSRMFRPADLRRENTNVSCDLERAFLQMNYQQRKDQEAGCFAGPPLDGTLGSRKSPSWL